MSIVRAGLAYFLIVFGAGFALGLVRVPFLVPRLGERYAELLEMPVMLAVIAWASWRLARRHPGFSRSARLASGLVALVMMVGAELLVAYFLGARSPAEYVASRDPVSGSVYLVSLAVFAVAPALWSRWPGTDHSSTATWKQPGG